LKRIVLPVMSGRPEKSATTSRAEGMRMTPGRGQSHLCWWPLIFNHSPSLISR